MFISHYNGHGIMLVRPLSSVVWITLAATTLVYPTVDSGLTITYNALWASTLKWSDVSV